MKVKKDLLRLKIKIDCKNKLAYQDCAYLVDKPEFLKLLPILRKKYSITKLVSLEKFKDWYLEKIKKDSYIYGTKGKMLLDAKKFSKKRPSNEERFNSLPYHERFDCETKLLTRRFKKPGYFHLIIKHAIICGEVSDDSWCPTYADVRPWELPTDEFLMPEVVIVLSPISRKNNVLKAFLDAKKLFKQNAINLKYSNTIKRVESKEIIRNRRWYWKTLEGKNAYDIYDEEFCGENSIYNALKNKKKDRNIDSIDRAITRYKEILQNY